MPCSTFNRFCWLSCSSSARAPMLTRLCQELWTVINMGSFFGVFWKCARIGERLSPYVSICCILMAVSAGRHHMNILKLRFRSSLEVESLWLPLFFFS
ncbi:hypothetical protein G4B84_000656 [Aspergillus flavus NRRL3357]|nr:uncharacterized protein G4B84_000656 [Aspergillus flavus NRRL3357]QMW25411.1 hypothetical protein G4B84_000656 [Aspergillus flavus NRRL3357]